MHQPHAPLAATTLRQSLQADPRATRVPRPSVFRRDELLGARFTRYTGGVKLVSSLDALAVRALIDEGFLEPTSCANPAAPTATVFAHFLERWAPAARAGGYARSHRSSDGGVVLDALEVSLAVLPAAARDRAWWEFYEIAVNADGQQERDGKLVAYWE
ncbi:MAG: hypothetical protein JNK05_10185 [Myxococcales bacterium]|nr:hypothetical protein [Myxococcales bacterium]